MPNTLQTNGQQPNQAKPKQKGTGFTNLQSILNANNGNALGQNLVKNVNQNVGNTVGNIQNANTQFGQQTTAEQARINALKQGAQGALNRVETAGSDTKADDKLVNDQDVNNYSQFNNTNYQGPSNLNNVDNLQNQQKNAQGYASALGSQGGQQQLLRTFVNQPNYTNTQQNLDSLILGGQPIQNSLKTARSNALQQLSTNNVGNYSTVAQQQSALNQNELGQGKQAIQAKTGQLTTGIQGTIEQKLKAMQDQANALGSQYGQLSSNNFGAVDANGNPLLNDQQQRVAAAYLKNNIGGGPQSFFDYKGANDLTNAGVASNQQAAQLAALGQLTGNSGLALNPATGKSIGDASVGSLNINDLVADANNRANPYLNTKNISDIASGLVPTFSAVNNSNPGTAGGLDASDANAFNTFLSQQTGGQFYHNNNLGQKTLNDYLTAPTSGVGVDSGNAYFASQAQQIQDFINKYYGLDTNAAQQGRSRVITDTSNTPVVKVNQ